MTRPECFEFGMDFLGGEEATEIREYVEQLEAERVDSDRLDFLESVSVDIGKIKDQETTSRAVMFFAQYDGDRPPTLREAIDNARQYDGLVI